MTNTNFESLSDRDAELILGGGSILGFQSAAVNYNNDCIYSPRISGCVGETSAAPGTDSNTGLQLASSITPPGLD